MSNTLTKADIVDAVYEDIDRNRNEVKTIVESLLATMKTAIKRDHTRLWCFGCRKNCAKR